MQLNFNLQQHLMRVSFGNHITKGFVRIFSFFPVFCNVADTHLVGLTQLILCWLVRWYLSQQTS